MDYRDAAGWKRSALWKLELLEPKVIYPEQEHERVPVGVAAQAVELLRVQAVALVQAPPVLEGRGGHYFPEVGEIQ